MTLKEALDEKIIAAQQVPFHVNTWGIYGESALIVFYEAFEVTPAHLEKLLKYKALADKLILALPNTVNQSQVNTYKHLEIVDAMVLYSNAAELAQSKHEAKLAFEGITPPSLSADAQARVTSL